MDINRFIEHTRDLFSKSSSVNPVDLGFSSTELDCAFDNWQCVISVDCQNT